MPKYNSINNIPAKLFFDVLHEKDFTLLEPFEAETEEEVEGAFVKIYDTYFLKSDNPKSKEFLRLRQEVAFITYKIESIVQVLDFLLFNTTTKEMRIMLLESLISIGVNINLEAEFMQEVQNILQVEIGQVQNEISFCKFDLEALTKTNNDKPFDYYESIVNFESILERNLPEDILLIKYIHYEKMCEKKVSAMSKINSKNKIN